MKRKVNKIILIMLFLITLLMLCSNKVFANNTVTITVGESKVVDTSETGCTWKSYKASDESIVSIEYDITYDNRGTVSSVKNLNVTALKAGECTITCSGEFNAHGTRYSKTKIITIRVVKKEEDQLKDKIDEGNQTITNMENAYKTIPGVNAGEDEIDTFVKSDATYNNLNSLKTVSKDTAKIWRDKLDAARIDQITRAMYTETIETLEDYINGEDVNSHKNNLSGQMGSAINATQQTVNELIQTQIDIGTDRTDVEFIDVLDNPNNYLPTDDISSEDAKKMEGMVSVILTVITNIGMIIAVLMVAILGLKYMIGSIEEKSEYKKDMIPYLVGAALLFGISTIVKVMQQFGESINNI